MHVAYALQPGGIGGTPSSGGLGGIEAFRGPEVTNATLVSAEPLRVGGSNTAATGTAVELALRFDAVGAGLKLADTSSCGLVPNHADKHWIANRTAQRNTGCSDATSLQELASSIACCCESPGNASFFVCAGRDAGSVRVSDPAAGCVPASARISGADVLTLYAALPSDAAALRDDAAAIRVAIMAVDFPGCALYSSFGLPTAPAFVKVETSAVPPSRPLEQQPASPKGSAGKGKGTGKAGFNALPPMGYNTYATSVADREASATPTYPVDPS